jgi:hypothetical protein
MDLDNKLKNIPHIYYFNLDCRLDRRDYMESQFKKHNIQNVTRVSQSKYLVSQWRTWIHLIDELPIRMGLLNKSNLYFAANCISHINFLMWWLENTKDDYAILIEDDCDLNLIHYWHFNWDYLMDSIPDDWECVLLGYETKHDIKFFLSPRNHLKQCDYGSCMITRKYAEKLVNLYYNNKFILHRKSDDRLEFLNICKLIGTSGVVYCLPLIIHNTEFGAGESNIMRVYPYYEPCRKAYYFWWKYHKNKFTLNDFFTYGKSYDNSMTISIETYMRKINAKKV